MIELINDLEMFFYVLFTEYWWFLAIVCMIIIALPFAIYLVKEHLEMIKEE